MRMRILTALVPFVFLSQAALAAQPSDPAYLGLYMNGSKVGYSYFASTKATFRGRPVTKTVSKTSIAIKLAGTNTTIIIDGITYSASDGKPIEMWFRQLSAGREQRVLADFRGSIVGVTVKNGGVTSHRQLTVPPNATIADDPLEGVVFSKVKPGMRRVVYILDPTTISFIRNEIVFKGPVQVDVRGKKTAAEWVQITDPRANTDVYCRSNSSVLKVVAPLGIEMYPESKAVAMASVGNARADLAIGTRLTPVGDFTSPGSLRRLTLDFRTPTDLGAIPNDEHQTVTKKDGSWLIDLHPPTDVDPSKFTIAQAAAMRLRWTKPDLNVPSNSPRFKKLARSIVGQETDVAAAARKIQMFVFRKMQPDASIAVLRDANEVLDSRRGVCRDYAILTATLMRAAGIPTQLVTGLVSWDGDFYYHAWVKVFNGSQWIGVDSTTDEAQISAAHVELAVGTVGHVFAAPVLEQAHIKVISSKT